MDNSYKFFSNKACKYYPCHKSDSDINCLFCFCPLYSMGDKCGGDFRMLSGGIKDCSNCTKTHTKDGYEYVIEKLKGM